MNPLKIQKKCTIQCVLLIPFKSARGISEAKYSFLESNFVAMDYEINTFQSLDYIITIRNSSCRKVMFSQECVISSINRGMGCVCRHAMGRGCLPGGGGGVCLGGVCLHSCITCSDFFAPSVVSLYLVGFVP